MGNGAGGRAWFLIALTFLLSRLFVWYFAAFSDVEIYANYAREQLAASRAGASFYTYHVRLMEHKADAVRSVEDENVEYPPLAVAFLRLPSFGILSANPEELPPAEFKERYVFAYRTGQALLDTGLFVLLIGLVRRLYPHESGAEYRQRLWGYVLPTAALWYLLFDRLDLVLALLILLALALLIRRVHYGWSFGLLALAVHFKLVPLVLAPVFVIGSLPAEAGLARSKPRLVAALAVRSLLLVFLIAAILLPFYVIPGNQCLGFLAYHQARGLEFESPYASVLLLLKKWTGPVEVAYSFKSVTLQSSLAPLLIQLAPWAAVGLLAAAALALLIHFCILLNRTTSASDNPSTLAQRFPQLLLGYALLLLMLFIATSKVFSPQYLLWLVPLVVLIPLGGKARRLFLWAFLLTCVLSTVIFPFLFLSDLLAEGPPQWKFNVPSARLTAALVLRNALFVGLTIGLAVQLLRRLNHHEEQQVTNG
jgi:hypothetical protein